MEKKMETTIMGHIGSGLRALRSANGATSPSAWALPRMLSSLLKAFMPGF